MTRTIPQQKLVRILKKLGFSRTRAPDSYVVFSHKPSGTIVVLPDQAKGDIMLITALGTRRILSERGLIEPEEFDRLLNGTMKKPSQTKLARSRRAS